MDAEREGKVVYFAHPIVHYDTDFEWECINVILTMLTPIDEDPSHGYIHIMNPNQRWLGNLYKQRRDAGHKDPFDIFRQIAKACDITVGCTFFDGVLGAGVAEECKTAQENGRECYLIFVHDDKKLFMPFSGLAGYKVLSRDETRERIDAGVM